MTFPKSRGVAVLSSSTFEYPSIFVFESCSPGLLARLFYTVANLQRFSSFIIPNSATMKITQLVTLCSGSIALLLNLILLPIIFLKSSDKIGRYKYFLMAYTTNAAIFCFSQASVLPAWYIPNNGYLFVSTVPFFPRWFQQSQILTFVICYTFNAMILMWSFIYRLKTLENSQQLGMSRQNLSITLVVSLVLACAMIATVQNILPSDEAEFLFQEEVRNGIGVEMTEIGYIGGEITINGNINVGMAVCLGTYVLFIQTACVVILFCWFKIGKKLSELRALGSSQYKFQYKLFVLLTLQTILPIVFNILPGFIIFVLSLSKNSIGDAALFFGAIVTFAQIADPLCTVFLVQDYKDFILRKKRSAQWKVASIPTGSNPAEAST